MEVDSSTAQNTIHQKNNTPDDESSTYSLYKKVDLITEGLNRYLCKQLRAGIYRKFRNHIRLRLTVKDRELIRNL